MNICCGFLVTMMSSQFKSVSCMLYSCSFSGSTCSYSSGWTRPHHRPGTRMLSCPGSLIYLWDFAMKTYWFCRLLSWASFRSWPGVELPGDRVFIWSVWGSWSTTKTANHLSQWVWVIMGWRGFWEIWMKPKAGNSTIQQTSIDLVITE